MKKALIINGSEKRRPMAEGRLAHYVTRLIAEKLGNNFNVSITDVAEGYDIEGERKKFLDADIIIYHTPIFWFNVSSVLKKYIDDVFAGGVFFIGRQPYGSGGLFTDKVYMISTTWNAQSSDLSDKHGFLGGRTADQILLPFHLANQYTGMRPLKTLSLHDVVHNPNIIEYKKKVTDHLISLFQRNDEARPKADMRVGVKKTPDSSVFLCNTDLGARERT
ncbi:MAG TPA: NAD(P)H-dependent oxidoreductase [Candidatus Saccharimonadales bacterium]|nr:NAD(P)H-dependent oxidoreductase [Candidatus Saccharimonadales bacterium]